MDTLILLIIAIAGLWRTHIERREDRERADFEATRRDYGRPIGRRGHQVERRK